MERTISVFLLFYSLFLYHKLFIIKQSIPAQFYIVKHLQILSSASDVTIKRFDEKSSPNVNNP